MINIMKTKIQNSIIYNGPSLIDGKPIIVVGIIKSGNTKTGNMLQTHIIRADINPLEASKTGEDYSICGNCKHKGKSTDNPDKKQAINRTCYVNIGQGPTVVFKAFKNGKYPDQSQNPEYIQNMGRGKMVRLGTYGDPSAVPGTVWDNLLMHSAGHTGYTHQHDINKPADYQRMMYSADTAQEAQEAHEKGYRTFRVIPVKQWQESPNKAILAGEILCPASEEAGKRVTCDKCKLCTGSSKSGKSIAIVAHGTNRKGF